MVFKWTVLIFLLNTLSFSSAAEFVPDNEPIVLHHRARLIDQSATRRLTTNVSKLNFFKDSRDWSISWPAADRVLISHRSRKKFILVVEYKSKISVQEASTYFMHDFAKEAKLSRFRALNIDGSILRNVEVDSKEINGLRVGRINFDLTFPDASAQFTERIWAENGRTWQISLVSLAAFSGNPTTHDDEMNSVMDSIMRKPGHSALWLNFFMPLTEANAATSEVVSPGSQQSAGTETAPGLHIPTRAECKAENIPDERRASEPGPKFSMSTLGSTSCGSRLKEGFDVMIEATKASFISGFQKVNRHAEENTKNNPCPDPVALPAHPSFSDLVAISQIEEMITNCNNDNFGRGVVQTTGDLSIQTLKGVGSLVNWVRTTKDPVSVVSAMIQSKVPGFLCTDAETQTEMYCKFVGAAVTAVGAAAATGVVTGGVGAFAGGATLTEAGAAAITAGGKAAVAVLTSPYTVPRDIAKTAVSVPKMAIQIVKGTGGTTEALGTDALSAKTAARSADQISQEAETSKIAPNADARSASTQSDVSGQSKIGANNTGDHTPAPEKPAVGANIEPSQAAQLAQIYPPKDIEFLNGVLEKLRRNQTLSLEEAEKSGDMLYSINAKGILNFHRTHNEAIQSMTREGEMRKVRQNLRRIFALPIIPSKIYGPHIVVFQGQAAELFSDKMVIGPISLRNRLKSHQVTPYGYKVVIQESEIVNGNLFVKKASLEPFQESELSGLSEEQMDLMLTISAAGGVYQILKPRDRKLDESEH